MTPDSPREIAQRVLVSAFTDESDFENILARALVEIDKVLNEPIMPESGYGFFSERLGRIAAILDGGSEDNSTSAEPGSPLR